MEDLGNTVGKFIKISKHIKSQRYTAYVRIYVYMDLTKELPKAIRMSWEDEDYLQTLDYKQIPFRCRRCHQYGHMFRDFPTNIPKTTTRKEEEKQDQGFNRVSSRKRGGRKQDNQDAEKKISVSNKFGALEDLSEENPIKQPKVKQGDQSHQEITKIPTNTGDETIEGRHLDNID